MGMILQSATQREYTLRIDSGKANLEIKGNTQHLDKPYLSIEYVPSGIKGRIYSSYKVTGLLFGYTDKRITTNKLLKMLTELGFSISSNTLREEIIKGVTHQEQEQQEQQKKQQEVTGNKVKKEVLWKKRVKEKPQSAA